jgi:predicted MFS family arabinose efflux permease
MRTLSHDNRLAALALFLWGIGEGLFVFILPLYLKELGAGPLQIGSILALCSLGIGLSHLPAGYLADRLGRKPVFSAGFALAAVSALMMFLARDLRLFVPALVAYYCAGFMFGPLTAYAAEARGTQTVQRAITLVSSGYWAAMIVSPAVGGLLGQMFGLRLLFGLGSAALGLSFLALIPVAHRPPTPTPAGQSRYASMFGNRGFLGFMALCLAALLAMEIGMPFGPNFLVEVRRFDVGIVGLLGSVTSLGTTSLVLLLGRRLPRVGFLVAQALYMLSLVFLLTTASLPWLMLVFFLRAGWFLANNQATAQVGRLVDTPQLGLAMGITQTILSVVMVVGPFVAGVLYTLAPALPFQVSLGLMVITLPLAWRFAPRRDAHTP